MSTDLRARLEEAKRRAAAAKAANAIANSTSAQSAAGNAAAMPMRSPPSAPAAGASPPPTYEMLPPTLVPSYGVTLNYRGDPSLTHRTAVSLARLFLSGTKRRRSEEEGLVRLGPRNDAILVDINDKYDPQGKLGEGAYGTVTQARELNTNDGTPSSTLRAVKEVQEKFTKESLVGYPPHLLREFDAVMRLRHPNVLHGIELGKSPHTCSVYLITEHGGMNLKDYLFSPKGYAHLSSRNGHPDAPNKVLSKVKCIAKQLLTGLAFLHDHCVLHRDLKTANILIDGKGVLRICDFGLARYYREGEALTGGVVTLMYRAPEVHFNIADYSSKIDMWSAGCVIAELLLKAPLFPADQEFDHFKKMCEVLGVPDDRLAFPGMLTLPGAIMLMQKIKGTVNNTENRLRHLYDSHPLGYRGAKECASEDFLDLLSLLLKWNPKDRPSAAEALKHHWFTTAPLPCEPEELMRPLPFAPMPTEEEKMGAAAVPISPNAAEAADEAEACAGKQDLDVLSFDHEQRRKMLNNGGGTLAPIAEEESQAPPEAE